MELEGDKWEEDGGEVPGHFLEEGLFSQMGKMRPVEDSGLIKKKKKLGSENEIRLQ